jgi:GGDEF domain-containing protein
MSGVEILRQMRTHEHMASIPVVVITAYPEDSTNLPYPPDLLLLKPVDIHELSNLVQRLRTTHGAARGLAHDPITGLYNASVFRARVGASLERVGRATVLRFGILFADVLNLDLVRARPDARQLNAFLRALADGFRTSVRPADTTAWSAEGSYFLGLIEDIPNPEACLRIVDRVQVAFNEQLARHPDQPILRCTAGMLICDAQSRDVESVMRDLTARRNQLRSGEIPAPAVFHHKVVLTQK